MTISSNQALPDALAIFGAMAMPWTMSRDHDPAVGAPSGERVELPGDRCVPLRTVVGIEVLIVQHGEKVRSAGYPGLSVRDRS